MPWPGGQWVFAPLGYKPAFGHQSVAIAPTYAPGLPLLMAGARALGGPCAVFASVITALYLIYFVFEAWWYLRFLIPAWPALMIGFASLMVSIGRKGRVLGWLAAIAIIWLGTRNVAFASDHSAFRLWQEERRYAAVGQLVRGATEPSSIVFSMQHSGSLRRYAGCLTLRFDNLDDAWLDRTIAWLAERGVAAYLVIEDWKAAQFRHKFRSQAAVTRRAAVSGLGR